MITTQRIDAIGDREATTLPTATTQKAFASITIRATLPNDRQAININNLDTAADLYVRLRTSSTGAAPTVSATDNDIIIPPKSNRSLQISRGVDIYLRHSGAGTINYTVMELL